MKEFKRPDTLRELIGTEKALRKAAAILDDTSVYDRDIVELAATARERLEGRWPFGELMAKKSTISLFRRTPDETRETWTTPVLYTEKWAYAPVGMEGVAELYDIAADPYAETDIVADHPDVVQELHAKLIGWLREIDAPDEAIAALA